MSIKFCPTCESIQTITTKNNKQYLICKNCETAEPIKAEEIIISTQKIKRKTIGEGAAEKTFEGHNFICKECKNDKCKVIDLGMMIGDEDWVYLLQCTKCEYSERVGDWC